MLNDVDDIKTKLLEIRDTMFHAEKHFSPILKQVHPDQFLSAQNLIHYLSLRSFEIRKLQDQLHILGLF